MAWLNCRQDILSKWSVKIYFWQKFRKSHTWKVCKINHWTESPEQTVFTQIRCHRTWHLIWVCTVCHSSSSISGTSTNIKMDLFKFEPAHNKTYNKTYATSEDSDQPVHLHSLLRVFTDCMCLLQPPGYSKRDKGESLTYWVDVQADLSLCWLQRLYCRFCCALAHLEKVWSGVNCLNI